MIRLGSPDETLAFGARLGAMLGTGDVMTLSGPLGAGKTVFARGILAGLGHHGDVPSPSYPLVIPYDPPAVRLPLLHVDLYRLDSPDALDELGLDEARYDGALVIEWPERMGARLWPDVLALTLAAHKDGSRALTAQVPPAWGGRWPPR
ncbi:tRNA (adenosine(37)-N6)-threonylcarbamoyltransferase complex ATPase subunit type 1 TsaE [Sphingomonas sp. SUN039]|uniref:tRNA (adenosine(37)-N6)-threonylcarbamoyltransferase complex ATPase subunit type 1 TsaE n=1 Tax=Sphingomonas sp. SUN039 TaxID=2937787 RepID=UPI002164C96A|nr:tRNA (adenosine(37)-N6)-threonylcarbamoyltransferase complex ATPase subunit type 1 TsaE [Sphingomonas sp. SUN039]UVO53553.1 tRNA (adenosine(37)-N6)-threonylcarbamoyltransferase complex ATPase subunit type 1 TsaE [Sphingomonas sp. SUN039]